MKMGRNEVYIFKDITHEITWSWLRRKNLKRETISPLTEAQNNLIMTISIEAKIDNTPKKVR